MSAETVLSIVETPSGQSVVSRFLAMSSAEFYAYHMQRDARIFFEDVPRQIAAWIARIRQLQQSGSLDYLRTLVESGSTGFAFQSAMARLAAEEAFVSHAARIAAANAAASAAEGTLVAGAGTVAAAVVVPVVAMVAVAVALGAPYYQAREEAKKEEYASGFAKGFITGLLKWELRFTVERFWDKAVSKNGYDELMASIRSHAQNKGLLEGRLAGLAKDDREKKVYLLGLHKLTTTSKADWSSRSDDWAEHKRARQVQISYVIALATAARKYGMIKQE
jgi:hypothetical protein